MAAELEAGQQNRCGAPRHVVDEDARLLLVECGCTISCRIVDISLDGCRLRTKERFTAGLMVPVEVAFKIRGLAFRFGGTTEWTDGRNLVDIRFACFSARRKADLVEALSEVEAENAAKAAQQAAEMQVAAEDAAAALLLEQSAPQAPQQTSDPKPAIVAQPLAKKLDPAEERYAQPWARVAGAEDEGFNPHVKPQPAKMQNAETEAASPSQAKHAPRERRVQARDEVNTTAAIFLINIASRLQGRILDLSLGGCRIRTDERFPVGIYTRVETEFRIEGLPFRLGGVVQAIHDRYTVGIRFLDISNRKSEQVAQLIEEIRQMKEQGTWNRQRVTNVQTEQPCARAQLQSTDHGES